MLFIMNIHTLYTRCMNARGGELAPTKIKTLWGRISPQRGGELTPQERKKENIKEI